MKFLSPTRIRKDRGAALVIVLGAVAVITMILIALLALVRTEHRSTVAFGESSEVKSLAEWPTNLVISQLRAATDSLGGKRTWASQPGMIRTYGTETVPDTGRAKLEAAFKLYSASEMIKVKDFDPKADFPPEDWERRSAHYVDLNEPVYVERNGLMELEFPIIHARAAEVGHEGFSVEPIAGADSDHPIPMPVKWIYVLEDGTLVMPDEGGGNGTAKFSGADAPTTKNPIKGRIAFWTDDESSKVNINTASEGKFWDVPRANTHYDAENYADKQPVRNEFNRYPGHPAMTSLSAVLEPYLGADPETYMKLAPFVEYGGSKHGTRKVKADTPPVSLDEDRLYASVDEFFFHAAGTDGGGNRKKNHPNITREMLEETRFLMTAHSRSPEVNLLDRPRISLWPIQQDEQDRNVVDRLFAFCSETTREKERLPYYFQRHSVHDLKKIEDGAGSSQSTILDFKEIKRNRDLYDYLTFLTEEEVPGFGQSFKQKYPLDQKQILTQMIDYCRSGLNTMALGLPTEKEDRGYFYVPPRQIESYNATPGEGQVLPLKIGKTMGFGRSVTITEAAVIFYASEHDEKKTIKSKSPWNSGASRENGLRAKGVRAYLMLEFFTPSPGFPSWSQNLSIKISGLDQFTLDGKNLNFPGDATVICNAINGPLGGVNGSGHICAHMNLFQPFFYNEPISPSSNRLVLRHRDMDSQDPEKGYAWHSVASVPVSTEKDQVEFGGGPITIVLSDPTGKETVQEINMNFPKTPMPVPFAWAEAANFRSDPPAPPHPVELSLNRRIRHRNTNQLSDFMIRPGDVVRSMEARADLGSTGSGLLPGGDLRLYAATPVVPESWFRPGGESEKKGKLAQYFDPENRFAEGLRNGNGWQYWGNFRTQWKREHGLDAINHAYGHPRNPYQRQSAYRTAGSLLEGTSGYSFREDGKDKDSKLYRDAHPVVAREQVAAFRRDGKPGDWDQGYGSNEDGAFINKPDETNSTKEYRDWGNKWHAGGYFQRGLFDIDPDGNNYSPNRQIASAVMFGSLPTGVKSVRPWETLLFCPNPAGRETPAGDLPDKEDHYGYSFPRDHLFLDLFWMPVVEPYAISEPFSTAGKINLNYEIQPFSYIKRRTGIKAVLDPIELMAVPEIALARQPFGCIKGGRDQAHQQEVRYGISTDHKEGTLRGFEKRFEEGDIFRTASEICEIFLVPRPAPGARLRYPPAPEPHYDTMIDWWKVFRATGDNVKEMPYNQIFPRVTTQSNVFQVHFRVQLLKNPKSQDPAVWDDEYASVIGEYRGSSMIERYIDPNDPEIPDFASGKKDAPEKTLSQYYRFRVIRKKQFSP